MKSESELTEKVERAALALRSARAPLFLSGAGISAESGIPTFRGADGLWNNYRSEDLATPVAFARDPALVWSWYNWRKRLIAEKQPNAAHYAAADISRKIPTLLAATQNVDGFHAVAGIENILEMHGNIYRTRCTACGDITENRGDILPTTPCATCAEPTLRPDIVWFGEALPANVLQPIYERLQICDAIVVVGTSGSVYPAAGFAVEVRRREGHVIEINVDEGHGHYANDIYLRGRAGEILPRIAELL
ncbi:SIR2 family NAD-dependent protein deacylase [Turneriella parva]|uniref:NAD-dependent protein deacylase n=1 Tax=Turneriella parva (strain ATCC BAA-1111 / DSM 21527 / NCTC 11395 / H) TaxID=869212 RepID=I4BBT9_TURPD|nr:NAD-dependent deacylase [Turneriella parva]AFM14746.1 NAD-dependent deacetylase [Turneriella parva DSM 21527]